MTWRRILTAVAAVFVLGLAAAPAQAQATRTWVSGVGDDVNPCSRTAPCKTFAGAISKTAAGGEISCLDPGGFGSLTVTKSITLNCRGTHGSMLAAGQINGLIVNGAGIVVTLRNVSLTGVGTAASAIRVIRGTVVADEVEITGFDRGVEVGTAADPAAVATAIVTGSSIVNSRGVALTASGANARILVGDTRILANTAGLRATDGGTITSLGGNTLGGNGTDGAFSGAAVPRR